MTLDLRSCGTFRATNATAAAWALAGAAAAAGSGVFAPSVQYPVGDVPFWVSVGDVDLDGAPDVVSANALSRDLSVLLNSGDGTLRAETRIGVGPGHPRSVEIDDIDGDGDTDLVASIRDGGGNLAVLLGDGAGGFQPAVQYGPASVTFNHAMADFDGDGDRDAAVLFMNGSGGGSVSLFTSRGDGSFDAPTVVVVFTAPILYTADIRAGDVTGDDHPDLVLVNDCPLGCDASIAVLDNLAGSFAAPRPVDLGVTNAGSVRLADLDGDGDLDLVIVECGAFPQMRIVTALNDGAGAFTASTTSDASQNCTGFTAPEPLALLDADLDGRLDVVMTTTNADEAEILFDQGGLMFSGALHAATGDQPLGLAVGDLDGDGRPDVVSADAGISTTSTVSVLLNVTPIPGDVNGDGVVGFADLIALLANWGLCPVPPCPWDLDGDGVVGFADVLIVLAAWPA